VSLSIAIEQDRLREMGTDLPFVSNYGLTKSQDLPIPEKRKISQSFTCLARETRIHLQVNRLKMKLLAGISKLFELVEAEKQNLKAQVLSSTSVLLAVLVFCFFSFSSHLIVCSLLVVNAS
jgi:hypothetical protein